jgi:hypothetical protein
LDTVKKFGDNVMGVTEAPRTVLSSYTKIYSDGTTNPPTAFPLGVTSGDMDLMSASLGGVGTETQAQHVEMIFVGNAEGSAVVTITGACDGGPEEAIASLAVSDFNTVVESGANDKWGDTIVLTNLHLSGNHIHVADSGNSRVAKFGFDAIGYRYISVYPVLTTTTRIDIYARYF